MHKEWTAIEAIRITVIQLFQKNPRLDPSNNTKLSLAHLSGLTRIRENVVRVHSVITA
jgi:hypothetical protein